MILLRLKGQFCILCENPLKPKKANRKHEKDNTNMLNNTNILCSCADAGYISCQFQFDLLNFMVWSMLLFRLFCWLLALTFVIFFAK